MKRHCLLGFVLLLILAACSENKDAVLDDRGSLYIVSTVKELEIAVSRAEADVNQFTLILENESNPEITISGAFSSFPDGTIKDIPVGSYGLTLTSHPDGFVPAFEDPWYEGLKSGVRVASGKTNMVSVECIQANAGVVFKYDPSLEAIGFGDIVPEMTQGGVKLSFEGENRNAKAYFHPQEVELKVRLGNQYLTIGGQKSQTLDLGKKQLWETTLKASQITGQMAIVATVKVISEPTHFIEFELGQSDPVSVTGVEIGSHTASFLAKGEGIEAMTFGVFATSSVDFMLNVVGMSEEELMKRDGTEMNALYLAQLNSKEGLLMNFDGMSPETAYSLMIMPTQNSMRGVQRYDFVTSEGISPDPNQDLDGPLVPGSYLLNIYQKEEAGVYSDPYENEIVVVKATKENMYIIKNLFLFDGIDFVAELNKSTGELIFTGKDVEGYDVFNDIAFIFNDGEFYAGIYLTDGVSPVNKLVFNVEDRKLSKAAAAMELRLFDPLTEEDLGWLEISPLNNPFTYVEPGAETDWEKVTPMRNKVFKHSKAPSTRAAASNRKGEIVLRSSVSTLNR